VPRSEEACAVGSQGREPVAAKTGVWGHFVLTVAQEPSTVGSDAVLRHRRFGRRRRRGDAAGRADSPSMVGGGDLFHVLGQLCELGLDLGLGLAHPPEQVRIVGLGCFQVRMLMPHPAR
jgi:hypothetical protein